MKVFFVNSSGDYPNQFPPLGLLYMASSTRASGHTVGFYDLGAGNAQASELKSEVAAFNPDIFGLSVYTTQIENTVSTIKMLRGLCPNARFVVGGPHVSALPGKTLEMIPDIDFEVIGEGEETFRELLALLQMGSASFSEIPGLCFRSNDAIVQTSARTHIKNLDDIPFPAHDLAARFTYSYDKFAAGRKVGIAVSSRGCPFMCTFCNKAVFGSSYRRRTAENLVAEIKQQKEILGIDEIYFVDDLFVTNQKWLDGFFERYRESNLGLPWKCLGRVDQVDKTTYRKMKENGCFLVQFGIESGDDKMLEKIEKRITREKASFAVKAAQEAGLSTATYFILGHPGDSYRSVLATIDFALSLNADVCHFFVLVPFPGTANYKLLPFELQNAWDRIRYYHKGQYPISLCDLTPPELYQLEKQARYEFYGRLNYLLRNVLTFRSPLKVTISKTGACVAYMAVKMVLGLTGRRTLPRIRAKAAEIAAG